jgi:hypothetical protein
LPLTERTSRIYQKYVLGKNISDFSLILREKERKRDG